MGTVQHYTVVATVGYAHDEAELAAGRIRELIAAQPFEAQVAAWQLIGPIDAVVNGYATYALLPDGSKRGWDTADAADEVRAAFIAEFTQRGRVAGVSTGDLGERILVDGEWVRVG